MIYAHPAIFPACSRGLFSTLSLVWLCVFALCLHPSIGSAQPAANKAKTPTKPAPKSDKKPLVMEKFEQPSDTALPFGFEAPSEPLPIMSLEQPIATKEELTRLNREAVSKFAKVLRDCDTSAGGKQIVEGSIRYRLAEMTLPEKRKDLPDLHRKLMREVTSPPSPGQKPSEIAAMAQLVNQELVKQISGLLLNNFYVRLHAVLILSELDYAPAHALLLQVIQAPDIKVNPDQGQPEAIKIAAMQGLIRILKFANPPATVAQRNTIAQAIVGELQKHDTHWWYQMRLIEGLRNMTVAVDAGNNKPFVVEALLAVIADGRREWAVRSKACYAIGRVPIPAAVKADDVVTAVSEYALQLSNAAAAKPENPVWKGCFWDLYLTFRPDGTKDKDGKDRDLDAERRVVGGLLARFKGAAQPAYDVIVPIARDVLRVPSKPPAAGDLKKLSDFVNQRAPAPNPDGKAKPAGQTGG